MIRHRKNQAGLNTVQKVLIGLTPLIAILAIVLFVRPSLLVRSPQASLLFARVTFAEVGAALLAVWVVSQFEASEVLLTIVRGKSLVTLAETILLFSSFLSLGLTHDYQRPLIFFLLISVYYATLLLDIVEFDPSPRLVLLKTVLGSAMMVESITLLYPGFIARDTYLYYHIAQFISQSGGGLPQSFTGEIWYNFSPALSILFSITEQVTHATLRASALLVGLGIIALLLVITERITFLLSHNRRITLLSIWFGGLVPSVWMWSTWPISEMLAMVLLFLCLLMTMLPDSSKLNLVMIPALVTIVITHGGVALENCFVMAFVFLVTRRRAALFGGVASSLVFVIYLLYVNVFGTSGGLPELISSLTALISPAAGIPGGLAPIGGLPGVLEGVSLTFWQIGLAALSWIGVLYTSIKETRLRGHFVSYSVLCFSALIVAEGLTISRSTNTDALRYVGFISYPFLAIFSAFGMHSLLKFKLARRVVVPAICAIFVLSCVTYVTVAPDLWQQAGQSAFAGSQLQFSNTFQEMSGQEFMNLYDHAYPVGSNFLLNFVNIELTANVSNVEQFVYWIPSVGSSPTQPFLMAYSIRGSTFPSHIAFPNPSNLTVTYSDSMMYVIYVHA